MKKRHKTQRFRFTVLNENTLDTVFTTRFTRARVIVTSIAAVVAIMLVFYLILFGTPIRHLLPGYLDPRLKQRIMTESFRVDSLSSEMTRQEKYMTIVRGLISGEYEMDTTMNLADLAALQTVPADPSERELEFRRQYEESERGAASSFAPQISTDGMLFYVPLRGEIVGRYNPLEKRNGLDIAAPTRRAVLAALDGKVIMTAYTPDFDYIVLIQHNNDFVSVYSQLKEVLKRSGETVKAGEAVAFIGKSSASAENAQLHFELWYKGHALNPEEYIPF
ncbi:MAG: M23 family metallopeptidase [Bacteroidales bacterium]|nr:M23 family metallopeptidase [Bacteroidales bacterium]